LAYWNLTIFLRLLDAARQAGVRRVVVAGSFAEYGRSGERYEFIPPHAPLEPTYAYAASKAAASTLGCAYAMEHGLEFAYLRIFSAFGEGQFRSNLWPALREAALAGRDFPLTQGEQVRDFVAAEEVAAQFWYAVLQAPIAPGQPWVRNVGSGQPIRIADFARHWWSVFGAKGTLQIGALPYRPNEVMRYVPLINPL
jgi:nucleoside-diphosphate-sugar epimerase